MGTGAFETASDMVSARAFFYGQDALNVYWRGVWFHLAGITVPTKEGMPGCVARMAGIRRKPGPKT